MYPGFFMETGCTSHLNQKPLFMAEIQTAIIVSKLGKLVQKRLSTRVDLTPMVDLGFLLITFFIFTTTLMQPSVMKLNLPEEAGEDNMPVAESKTLNLVLCKNNMVGYYMGADANRMQFTNYSPAGLRSEIEKAQNKIALRFGDKLQLFTVIKPTSESSYKNVVDVLDEMLINNVTRYVLTEADENEIEKSGKE